MSLLSFLKRKPPQRPRIHSAALSALLHGALHKRGDYDHMAQKDIMAVITVADVLRAADAAFMPWRENVWECEDQARAVIHHAQRMAANEGCSWAVGTLRAQPPPSRPQHTRHVYVWAVVTEENSPAQKLVIYDATARGFISREYVREVDYTIT